MLRAINKISCQNYIEKFVLIHNNIHTYTAQQKSHKTLLKITDLLTTTIKFK